MKTESSKQLERIRKKLTNLAQTVIDTKPSPISSPEFLLRALVKPEHLELARETAMMFSESMNTYGRHDAKYEIDGIKMYITLVHGGTLKAAIPNYGFRSFTVTEEGNAVREYIEFIVERAKDHTLIWYVVNELYSKCSNMRQVRYFYPGILALLTSPEDRELRFKLMKPSYTTVLPELSLAFRELCKRATELTSQFALASSRPADKYPIKVRIREGKYIEIAEGVTAYLRLPD